tara:strand:- start:534 stop:1073 length:540 start_codon:yes stop_codon:yes gene_type:complete
MSKDLYVIHENGIRKIDLSVLETILQRNALWLIKEMEDNQRKKLKYNDDFIEEESYIAFSKWFNKEYSEPYLPVPVKKDKRQYSTTHRIEIAYKTKYKCNACSVLLPPTFEIDHIVEIRDGGKDEYDNLQALCPNCHSLKTRANTLKRHKAFQKEFGKRAREMEKDAFEKFKYKKSKYF